jgi:hypothetical protein
MKAITAIVSGLLALVIGVFAISGTFFFMEGASSRGFTPLMLLFGLAIVAVAVASALLAVRLPARLQKQPSSGFGLGSMALGVAGSGCLASVVLAVVGILVLVLFYSVNR